MHKHIHNHILQNVFNLLFSRTKKLLLRQVSAVSRLGLFQNIALLCESPSKLMPGGHAHEKQMFSRKLSYFLNRTRQLLCQGFYAIMIFVLLR